MSPIVRVPRTVALRLNRLQDVSGFCPVSRSRFVTVCCVSCSTVGQLLVSPCSLSSFSFVVVMYLMTVILTAEVC